MTEGPNRTTNGLPGGGKYHNKREFVAVASELSLAWQGQPPHPVIGFSEVQLTEQTLADYADTLGYLGAAIRLYRDTFRRLGLLGGQGQGEGQDGDGQPPHRQGRRAVQGGLRLPATPVVLDPGQAVHARADHLREARPRSWRGRAAVGQLVAGEGEPERGVDARAVEEVQQLLTGSRPSSRNPVPLGEIVSTPAEPLWAAERSRSFLERARRRCRCHCGGTLTGYPSGVHFLGRFGDEVTPAETTATRYAGERR